MGWYMGFNVFEAANSTKENWVFLNIDAGKSFNKSN